MKKDFQRKGEDAQAAYDRRRKEMFTPLQDDIGKALEVYAKATQHKRDHRWQSGAAGLRSGHARYHACFHQRLQQQESGDRGSDDADTVTSSWRLSQLKDAAVRQLMPRPASLYSTMETILDSQAIQELLPHRFPFLLVDRIIELVPRERIVGIKQVSINEPFFQGHFPGAPVMPGVLVVEALAQVGAVLALREIEDRDSKLVLFTGIREARFRKPVVPGDTLTLEVTALRIGSRVQRMRGEAKVDGQLVADADIMSIIADRGSAV